MCSVADFYVYFYVFPSDVQQLLMSKEHPVPVKIEEEEEEEKPQSVQLFQIETSAVEEDCGFEDVEMEPVPETEIEVKTEDSSEAETDKSNECREKRDNQPELKSMKTNPVGWRQSNKKHWNCNKYGQTYRDDNSLKNHKSMHSREKPFNCSVCGKSFSQKINL